MIPGIGTNKLTLTVDGVERYAECSTVVITSKESDADFVSFKSASEGGSREYGCKIVAVQAAEAATLWDLVWSASGTEVPILVRPYGNASPSAAQPHFAGVVTVSEPDGDYLGGSADRSTSARMTFSVEWVFTEKPTRLVA